MLLLLDITDALSIWAVDLPYRTITIFLIVLSKYYFSKFYGSCLLGHWSKFGVGVEVDGRVQLICPKAAPLDYEYVVVIQCLSNTDNQKITTNPSG